MKKETCKLRKRKREHGSEISEMMNKSYAIRRRRLSIKDFETVTQILKDTHRDYPSAFSGYILDTRMINY